MDLPPIVQEVSSYIYRNLEESIIYQTLSLHCPHTIRGLAEQSEVLVNWCAALGTVLANEEVIDGKSERGDHPVERIPLRQWVLKVGR